MEKPAINDYPIHDLIRQRWSPRAFSSKAVSSDVLKSLFEAARWAASSYNDQPWAYMVATQEDRESFAKFLSVLADTNILWAKHAPVMALSVARMNYAHNGHANRAAFHDVGAANAQLTLQAMAHGLVVHPMGGFSIEKAREVFQLPVGWEPVIALAIGYPGDIGILSDALRERELGKRTRKPLAEFVMSGTWGATWPVLP